MQAMPPKKNSILNPTLSYKDSTHDILWDCESMTYDNCIDTIDVYNYLDRIASLTTNTKSTVTANVTNPRISLTSTSTTMTENKGDNTTNMFENMFNGMFKPVTKGCAKMAMNGQIAIKTSTGYKTFDVKKNKLTNCDNFAFDMDGMFWVVPTFKVEVGDIVLVNGKPRCVIEVDPKYITVFSYEDSTIDKVLPEHHVFMGKTYCYGKIFTPFSNMGKDNDTMQSMMSMMMMSQMFNGNGSNSNMGMNPMMFMMMGGNGNPFEKMFAGAFDFGDDAKTEEE